MLNYTVVCVMLIVHHHQTGPLCFREPVSVGFKTSGVKKKKRKKISEKTTPHTHAEREEADL